MVRCEGGSLFETFKTESIVALGWHELAGVSLTADKPQWLAAFALARPELKEGARISGVSQVLRFVREMRVGDAVLTYDPSTRSYLLGEVVSEVTAPTSNEPTGKTFTRRVRWKGEFGRDALSVSAKKPLGSTLSFFLVPQDVAGEIVRTAMNPHGAEVAAGNGDKEASTELDVRALREDIEAQALEFIKDKLSKLDGYELQALVAGVLRGMGYKTRESKPGPDRGLDILASPDGLGFESPRIAVEVKHRSGQVQSRDVRSFVGGRHTEDRGLYVSTGGFSKDSRYEADRSKVPMMLWDFDDLVRYLTEHYEHLDLATQQLIPLRRLYWPL